MEPQWPVSPSCVQGSYSCIQSIGTARNREQERIEDEEASTEPYDNQLIHQLVPAVCEAINKMNLFYERGDWDRVTLYACLAQGRLQYLTELMARVSYEEDRENKIEGQKSSYFPK